MGNLSKQLMPKWRFAFAIIAIALAVATNAIAQTGTLSYIKIVEGAAGNGPELANKTLTTDQALVVHAAGFDANNNYLGDESVSWSVSGGIGTLTPASGATTTLNATTTGAGLITADHLTATDDVSGFITVTAGAPLRVKVLSGASGNTSEVASVTLTSGQTFTVHAGSFDADGNYLGDATVSWSVTGGIGTLNPATGISTTFVASSVGSGIIAADHATLLDDTTGAIIVTAGTLSYVKIVEGAAGNGPELGNKTLTTDQTLTVHAAGYDASGNYLGDLSVAWSVTGGIGTVTPSSGTTTTLNATTPGAGAIRADHATAMDDMSGTITVVAGAAFRVKILAGASGNTSEVGATTLTSGQLLIVHASGFDADGNYIADVSVNWSVSGNIGTLNPIVGVSTIFTATNLGAGVITADHSTLIDDATGVITVSAGSLSYIKIVEGSSGNGQELGARTLTTDQSLTVHAAGYDAGGNYLGDQPVTWSVTGGIGVLSITTGISTTFNANVPGAGVISADHATVTDDVSGAITVVAGAPHRVKVLSGAIGVTAEVGNVTLTSGQTLIVHASSFDADNNYVGDLSVTWSVSGGIGTLSVTSGVTTTFTATSAGGGIITADHPSLIDDTTGFITVLSGALSHVKIVEGASGNGPELGAKTMTTDQALTVHAAGYDASGNYLGDFSVTWSLSGSVGTLSPATGTATALNANRTGTGIIIADHVTAVDDVSGTITVTVGAAHRVKVLAGASGNTAEVTAVNLIIGATLVVHASSFDADDNHIAEVSVAWTVSGGIGTLSPAAGITTTFTATTPGVGVIAAAQGSLIQGVTGVITVSPATQVDSNSLAGAPQNFQLLQNYPNPFQAGIAATQIRYELPINSSIKISIYNVSGQLIRVLFDGRQNAGRYAATWDGRTIDGRLAPSGVYLIRMEAGDPSTGSGRRFVAARKMVVAR